MPRSNTKITGGIYHTSGSVITKEEPTVIDHDSGMEGEIRIFDNYLICEFVVVPHDFEIKSLLTLREQAGIFPFKQISLHHLRLIADGVKYSPVYNMVNNSEKINFRTCLYFLHILYEAGLILTTVDSPVRRRFGSYQHMIDLFTSKNGEEARNTYIDSGTMIKNLNFSIINMFNLLSDEIVDETITRVNEFIDYQKKIKKGMNGEKID